MRDVSRVAHGAGSAWSERAPGAGFAVPHARVAQMRSRHRLGDLSPCTGQLHEHAAASLACVRRGAQEPYAACGPRAGRVRFRAGCMRLTRCTPCHRPSGRGSPGCACGRHAGAVHRRTAVQPARRAAGRARAAAPRQCRAAALARSAALPAVRWLLTLPSTRAGTSQTASRPTRRPRRAAARCFAGGAATSQTGADSGHAGGAAGAGAGLVMRGGGVGHAAGRERRARRAPLGAACAARTWLARRSA